MKTKWVELEYATYAMNVPGGVIVRHANQSSMVFVPDAKVVTEDGVPVLIPARLA